MKDREYGPASEGGAGGTENANGGTGGSKGGSSGKSNGGSSGMGATGGTDGMAGDNSETGGTGTGMGGTGGGSGGSTGTGGSKGGTGGSKGGTSNRGGSSGTGTSGTSGGAGEAGASGEAGMGTGGTNASGGMNATGGTHSGGGMSATGGSAGTGTVCVPSGSEVCTDGIDNDCDGVTDCLTLTSEFPAKNGAASASDVAYTFSAHASSGSFECRSYHGTTASGSFGACGAVSGNTVSPFTAAFAQNAANDGYWTTEVRLHFANGGNSAVYKRTVYVHHTLYGAARCAATTSDQAYANYAKTYLEDAGAITETNVRSPFVQVPFTPPVDGRYYVTSADGTVNWMSLRRNFGFSSDGHYMVMTRNYTSSNAGGMGCAAAGLRTHTTRGSWVLGKMQFQSCTALVFNKKGAGLCLGYSAGAITIAPAHVRGDGGAQIPTPPYSLAADNFAWRKMTAHIEGGATTNFYPKCDTSGCTTGTYLPDKSFFPYFTQ